MTHLPRITDSSRRDFLKTIAATAVGTSLGILGTTESSGGQLPPDLTFLSATKLARLIANGQVSALDVAEAHLKRIAEVNPQLNAIVQMDADRIRAEARQADKELKEGVNRGPLHGVPFTIKDNILTKGIITTNGCPELKDYKPREDATVVKRLREAGGILLGKTNVPEMCFGSTDNLVYGRTNNPYDPSRSPGGSSGGEAAIIAAGGSPFGVGTDIGGSVRDPANFCGIAGIKPTSHRVPDTGVLSSFPLTVRDWKAIGPLARHVEDLELVLKIIAGPDGMDPHIVPLSFGNANDVRIDQLRVAFYTDEGVATPTKEIQEAIERAAQVLNDAGVATVKKERPPGVSQAPDIWLQPLIPSWSVAIRFCQREYARMGETEVSASRSPVMELVLRWLDFLYTNGDYSPDKHDEHERHLRQFRLQMMQFMAGYDVLLSPVTNAPAGPHLDVAELAKVPLADLWSLVKTSGGGYYCTHNLTGWPAVVVRAGTSPEGLPIGVQIAAKAWREDIALAVAKIVEDRCGGWQRPPLL